LNKYLFLIIFISIIGSFSGTTNGGLKINKISLFFISFKEIKKRAMPAFFVG